MAHNKFRNPFYALLIPVGLAFVVTGFAYGYMAFQAVNTGSTGAGVHSDHPLFQWLNEYGDRAMLIELAVLAVLTFGAIATDSWWMEDNSTTSEEKSSTPENVNQEDTESQGDG